MRMSTQATLERLGGPSRTRPGAGSSTDRLELPDVRNGPDKSGPYA
jgi:hypothetical protein